MEACTRKQHEMLGWRRTTSMPTESKVFGRANEKDHLIKLLLKEDEDEECGSYSVLSIVGIGGVGKTTLAQSVYNEQAVMDHFDLMAWVHVAEKFDVERVTIQMIESATDKKSDELHNLDSLDKIQRILKEIMIGKKFLVVLDDVWNEISSQWENLRKPFQFAKEGSRVMITTRNQDVAELTAPKEVIYLKGLEDEDYWTFFVQCAFGDTNPKDHPKLELIGTHISKKLGGSPLAAKTVGGVLKSKLEEPHWRGILESRLWQVAQKEDDIIPALKLSYEHLPKNLRQCFVVFALFPKDYLYHKDRLVQIWMAHGFIEPNHGEKRKEDIGAEHIDDLLRRSFIQCVAGSEDMYMVHGLLHDLAESVSNGEHFRIEGDFSVDVPRKVRHLYVHATNMIKIYEHVGELKNLRSLIVFRDSAAMRAWFPWLNFRHVFQETLGKLKGLRVLMIDLPQDILPESLDHLVHLRYLDIQSNSSTELPKSVFRLYHLQGFNLKVAHSQNLQRPLLADMNRLINLRYLNAHPEAISTISGIGKLTSLQGLKEFHLKDKEGYDLGQLKNMKQLRGQLCLRKLELAKSYTESRKAELDNKGHLEKLSLHWTNARTGNIKHGEHEDVLEGLRPHPNLMELHIAHYMGAKPPSWLDNSYALNLEFIELSCCHYLRVLPQFGQLPFLRILQLRSLKAVRHIGSEFYGDPVTAFPSLEELLFEDMVEWKEWLGVGVGRSFPRLCKLCIRRCGKLKGPLPLSASLHNIKIRLAESDFFGPFSRTLVKRTEEIYPITELSIDRVWFLFKCLPQICLASLYQLDISCYFLRSFTNEQEEWLAQLTSLKQLRFSDCKSLRSLPAKLESLPSLEALHIEKCPELKSLPDTCLPTSLKELSIVKCHSILKLQCKPRTGLDWSKISHIPTITIDERDIREELHSLMEG
ncbi:putative disease resistance RPP13-like protein 1 isoform X2 [Typha latifolia]